jgi:nucleoid DNA-binding protein
MSEKKYNKEWLIREIASRARFTQGDVKIIWETFEDIVREVVLEEAELRIAGIFKLYVATLPERWGVHPQTQDPRHYGEAKRVVFGASKTLKKLFDEEEE